MSKEQKQNYKGYSDYIKAKKASVEDSELNARYQKANYDTMYYAIEAEKIKEDYLSLMERLNASKSLDVPEEQLEPQLEAKLEEVEVG